MGKALDRRVVRVSAYLRRKYDTDRLTNYQACKELRFRGRELGEVLFSPALPSLKIVDVARYIVLHT